VGEPFTRGPGFPPGVTSPAAPYQWREEADLDLLLTKTRFCATPCRSTAQQPLRKPRNPRARLDLTALPTFLLNRAWRRLGEAPSCRRVSLEERCHFVRKERASTLCVHSRALAERLNRWRQS